MASIQLDLSGRGGLAPRFGGDLDRTVASPELRYLGSDTQMADGVFNPFRRYGYMSPSNGTFTDVLFSGSAPAADVTSSIYDVLNDDFYLSYESPLLFKGDTLDDLTMTQTSLTITGTIQDLEIYEVNGVRKLFYIYEDGSNDMEVGIATLPFQSENDTWLSATVSGAFSNTLTNRAFMRVADNGFAYLFQDNNIHKIDGTTGGGANGTVTANVIQFPAYFQITDAIDYRGFIFTALRQDSLSNIAETEAVFASQVGVYVWDRQSTTVNSRDFIPLTGVKFIKKIYVAPNGKLRMIVLNTERHAEIREYNGSTFKVIQEVGYIAHPVYHDSLTTNGYFTIWAARDGHIYAHGQISPSEKEAIYKIGQFDSTMTGAGYPGAILYGGANSNSTTTGFKKTKNALYLYYKNDGATKAMKSWDIYGTGADGVSANQAQGDIYSLVKFLPQMSTLKNAEIYCFPISISGSTTAATIKFYANQSTTAFKTKVVTRDEAARGYVDIELDKPYINSVQIEIEYNTSVTVGTTDFAPSFAVINYEPTKTKG